MKNLLKAEMKKLGKSFPLKTIILAMCIIAVVTAASSLSYVDSPMQQEMGMVFGGYDAFLMSLRDVPILIILGIISVGIVVCGDFDNRTIQAEIYAGHTRGKIVVSKFIAMAVAYTVTLLPYPLGRLILQSIFYGFGAPTGLASLATLLTVFLVSVVIGVAISSVGVMIAFVVRKTVITVAASILLLLLGGNVLLSFGYSIPALGAVLDKTPLGLSKSLFANGYPATEMGLAVFVCFATIVVIGIITTAAFKKAELK